MQGGRSYQGSPPNLDCFRSRGLQAAAVTQFILALLASFGVVLGIAAGFVLLYRRYVRQWRRQNRSVDQLARITSARRRVLAFPMPPRWVAVRTSNSALVREVLGQVTPSSGWADALGRARERALFVSAPVDG